MSNIEARMRQLVGTTAEWAADDLVIGDGEIAIERTDAGQVLIKIGNGVDQFSELPYQTLSSFGPEYTWRNVTGTFTLGANHTSPDHPIQIIVRAVMAANDGTVTITVGGLAIAYCSNGGNGAMAQSISAIVPPGSVYRVDQVSLSSILIHELRAD
jgi:hypothetical protein